MMDQAWKVGRGGRNGSSCGRVGTSSRYSAHGASSTAGGMNGELLHSSPVRRDWAWHPSLQCLLPGARLTSLSTLLNPGSTDRASAKASVLTLHSEALTRQKASSIARKGRKRRMGIIGRDYFQCGGCKSITPAWRCGAAVIWTTCTAAACPCKGPSCTGAASSVSG